MRIVPPMKNKQVAERNVKLTSKGCCTIARAANMYFKSLRTEAYKCPYMNRAWKRDTRKDSMCPSA